MVVCCAETVILGTKRHLFLPKVPSFTHLAIYKRVARLYATLGTGPIGKEFYDRAEKGFQGGKETTRESGSMRRQ